MDVPHYITIPSNFAALDRDEVSVLTFIGDNLCRWHRLSIDELDRSSDSCLPKCPRRRRSKSRSQRSKATGSPVQPKRKHSRVLSNAMLEAIGMLTIEDDEVPKNKNYEKRESTPILPERRVSEVMENVDAEAASVALSYDETSVHASTSEANSTVASSCKPTSPQSRESFVFGGGLSKHRYSFLSDATAVHSPQAQQQSCIYQGHLPMAPLTGEPDKESGKQEEDGNVMRRRLSDLETPPRQPKRKASRGHAEL